MQSLLRVEGLELKVPGFPIGIPSVLVPALCQCLGLHAWDDLLMRSSRLLWLLILEVSIYDQVHLLPLRL